MPTPLLKLEAISKSYPGGTQALRDINLTVDKGEILCLLGPSGCGKSTLLRVIAGLETPDRGRVLLNAKDLVNVPVHKRGFGFMFQDFALFPHRTVAENIAFGLRMEGKGRGEQDAQVAAMLELVNLPGYGKRTIFELSGGERQRVALARSLAPEPALLMLDEPLGSLDRGLREELVEELRTILKKLDVTSLYVTHDQEEAMALGDRMVIMNRGRIEQIGTPAAIYDAPATPFVASFMGFNNLLEAAPAQNGITTPLGIVPLSAPSGLSEMTLLIRPGAAQLAPPKSNKSPGFHTWAEDNQEDNQVVLLVGRLVAATYHGNYYRIKVEVSPRENTKRPEPYVLSFDLPTVDHFQQSARSDGPSPLKLPAIGEPIELVIEMNMSTVLPYPALLS